MHRHVFTCARPAPQRHGTIWHTAQAALLSHIKLMDGSKIFSYMFLMEINLWLQSAPGNFFFSMDAGWPFSRSGWYSHQPCRRWRQKTYFLFPYTYVRNFLAPWLTPILGCSLWETSSWRGKPSSSSGRLSSKQHNAEVNGFHLVLLETYQADSRVTFAELLHHDARVILEGLDGHFGKAEHSYGLAGMSLWSGRHREALPCC